MLEIVVIGIGSGNPEHMTIEAVRALNAADRVLIPRKGEAKSDLADLRREICARYLENRTTRLVEFEMPVRETGAGYRHGVDAWHRAIAERYRGLLDGDNAFLETPTEGVTIYWGAYLGMPDEILIAGALADVAERIAEARAKARAEHGWIMDTYLLRRS